MLANRWTLLILINVSMPREADIIIYNHPIKIDSPWFLTVIAYFSYDLVYGPLGEHQEEKFVSVIFVWDKRKPSKYYSTRPHERSLSVTRQKEWTSSIYCRWFTNKRIFWYAPAIRTDIRLDSLSGKRWLIILLRNKSSRIDFSLAIIIKLYLNVMVWMNDGFISIGTSE